MAEKRKDTGPNKSRPRRRRRAPGFQVDRRGGEIGGRSGEGPYWIYGSHAALAAIGNPKRRCHRLLMTAAAAESLESQLSNAVTAGQGPRPRPEIRDRADVGRALVPGAVHQGIAVHVDPLADVGLPNGIAGAAETAPIVILDQATDPHNVGAVLRSAAAFGAAFVVCQTRHAPNETSILAKAASGALEIVPLISVTNVARALIIIKEAGYWSVGLDGSAEKTLSDAKLTAKTALVMGAEGSGLRRLTRDSCDELLRIKTTDQMDSLNLSNACAIGLYELTRSIAAPA